MPGLTPHVQPCPVGDREAALEVLYRRVPASLRPRLIANALAESARGVIDLSRPLDCLAARPDRRGDAHAALGRTRGGGLGARGRPHLEAAPLTPSPWFVPRLEDLRGRGSGSSRRLARSSPAAARAADLAGGMPHVTDLVYLERAATPP